LARDSSALAKICGPRLTAKRNSGERCPTCCQEKPSDRVVTSVVWRNNVHVCNVYVCLSELHANKKLFCNISALL